MKKIYQILRELGLEEKADRCLILKFPCFIFFLSLWHILLPGKTTYLLQQMHNNTLTHNSAKHSSWKALSQISQYSRHTNKQCQTLPSYEQDFDWNAERWDSPSLGLEKWRKSLITPVLGSMGVDRKRNKMITKGKSQFLFLFFILTASFIWFYLLSKHNTFLEQALLFQSANLPTTFIYLFAKEISSMILYKKLICTGCAHYYFSSFSNA